MTLMLTSMSRASQLSSGEAAPTRKITICRRRTFGIVQTTFLIASMAAHAAVLLFFLERHINEAGRAAQNTEAISVELATSSVTQAAQIQSETEIEASSNASMQSSPPEIKQSQPEEVMTKDIASEAVSLVTPQSKLFANEDLEIIPSTNKQAADELPNAPKALTGQDKQSQQHTSKDKVYPEIMLPRRKDTTKPVKKNLPDGANKVDDANHTMRASNRSAASSGRLSASKGDVVSYAARVRAQVASRRPNGNGVRGTVVIAFTVARSGALVSARISSSSGNAVIDRATLAAVRSAGQFPPPPSGSGSVSFAVPFHYR